MTVPTQNSIPYRTREVVINQFQDNTVKRVYQLIDGQRSLEKLNRVQSWRQDSLELQRLRGALENATKQLQTARRSNQPLRFEQSGTPLDAFMLELQYQQPATGPLNYSPEQFKAFPENETSFQQSDNPIPPSPLVARCNEGCLPSPLVLVSVKCEGDCIQRGKAQGTCPTEPFEIVVQVPLLSTVLNLVSLIPRGTQLPLIPSICLWGLQRYYL